MDDARRLAYLDALGIDVWVPRSRRPAAAPEVASGPLLTLGDGDGGILCIARSAGEARLKLAADISRAMASPPIWAWPASDAGAEAASSSLEGAVGERLFTQVLVFGRELAESLFGPEPPEMVETARIHLVPGLARLGRDREAKRTLWDMMCRTGIAARQVGGASDP